MGGSFALRVAWRYIFSRKSTNAINIISGITMLGITIGSAALIIVLSAFNGFGSLVIGLYGAFYPDITITPAQGKVFNANPDMMKDLGNIPGVLYISQTLEENAMLAYNEQEHIATIKGVDSIYSLVTAVDDSVFAGEYVLRFEHFGKEVDCAILGSGVAATLNVALGLDYPAVRIFMPRRGSRAGLDPRNAFIQQSVQPVGAFRVQADFDGKYVITGLSFVRQLLEYDQNEVSALEIQMDPSASVHKTITSMQNLLGDDFVIKDRAQQNEFLYKVMRNERWVVFLILTFILIIATFNMIGSISMLVIDKRKDISTLRAMGATNGMIRNIFFIQGVLQTLVSIGVGFSFAALLCWIQIRFGVVTIPGSGSFVVSAYPIDMHLMDFFNVGLTILIIGSIASWFPAHLASKEVWMFRAGEGHAKAGDRKVQ